MSFFDQLLVRAGIKLKRIVHKTSNLEPSLIELEQSLARLEGTLRIKIHLVSEAGQGYVMPLYSQTLLHGFSFAFYNCTLVSTMVAKVLENCDQASDLARAK